MAARSGRDLKCIPMDNREIARLLRETADLMEIAGDDSFRIRSYRRAADAVETCPQPLAELAVEPKRLLELPGIGKTIAAHLVEILTTGVFSMREELLKRYRPSMLQLLQIQGLGPRTIALIWERHQAATVDEVEALARAGKLRELPRMGERAEQKLLKAIAAWRAMSGRFLLSDTLRVATEALARLKQLPEVELSAAAGSLRRGRETVGDLDLLVAGRRLQGAALEAAIDHFLGFPGIVEIYGRGESKLSVRLHSGLQVDVRWLPPESFGAGLQYFTGSQAHNITLRGRALKAGLKLNEYGLFPQAAEGAAAAANVVAGKDRAASGRSFASLSTFASLPAVPAGLLPADTAAVEAEARIYHALGLDWISPELREDGGEIEAAATGQLPRLIAAGDIRGDLHMHTVASDGRASIEEMAEAALARGYEYIAITEHSQSLAMANGLNERRMLEHLTRIRAADASYRQGRRPAEGGPERPLRILAGIEVDILADGRLDLADDVLAQLDIVIGSVHSRFDQEAEAVTARLLRAIEHPSLRLLGHLTGRILLRREPLALDFEAVLAACARHGVSCEINASPDRLDLHDRHARRCRETGVKVAINTDAHHPRHLALLPYGLCMARRAWLEPKDVLNTLPAEDLLRALRGGASSRTHS